MLSRVAVTILSNELGKSNLVCLEFASVAERLIEQLSRSVWNQSEATWLMRVSPFLGVDHLTFEGGLGKREAERDLV